MKVAIFTRDNFKELQNSINDFLSYINPECIVDIKLSESKDYISAMIIYKT